MSPVVFEKPQKMDKNLMMVGLTLVVLFCIYYPCAGHVNILKAECTSLDLSFAYFKSCEMKSQENKHTIVNIHTEIRYKKPIDDVTVSTLR